MVRSVNPKERTVTLSWQPQDERGLLQPLPPDAPTVVVSVYGIRVRLLC